MLLNVLIDRIGFRFFSKQLFPTNTNLVSRHTLIGTALEQRYASTSREDELRLGSQLMDLRKLLPC
jgi:hypothetical protein